MSAIQKNTLEIFDNQELGQVRVILKDNKPLFCLSDICKILELTNTSMVKESIDSEFEDDLSQTYPILDSLNREQKAIFITEPQLYFVLLRSDKPKAKPFRKWVTSEVLPSIRKNGMYATTSYPKIPANYIEALELALTQAKSIQLLENKIQTDKPLVSFANSVANASNAISIGEFAKLLFDEKIQIGQNRLFKWLRDNKYLLPNNQPYQEMIERGYFKLIENTYQTPFGEKTYTKTTITGKGQIYFTEKLREVFK